MQNEARQRAEVSGKQTVIGAERQRDFMFRLQCDHFALCQTQGQMHPAPAQKDPIAVDTQMIQVQVVIYMDGCNLERPIARVQDLDVDFESALAHQVIDLTVDEEDPPAIEVAVHPPCILHPVDMHILPGVGVRDGIRILDALHERDSQARPTVLLERDRGDRSFICQGQLTMYLKCRPDEAQKYQPQTNDGRQSEGRNCELEDEDHNAQKQKQLEDAFLE